MWDDADGYSKALKCDILQVNSESPATVVELIWP